MSQSTFHAVFSFILTEALRLILPVRKLRVRLVMDITKVTQQ